MDPDPASTRAAANDVGDGGPDTPPRQRSSVTSLLFFSFILFMLTNRNNEEAMARDQYLEALQIMSFQLGNYTAWLNGTESNFTLPERHPAILPLVQSIQPLDGQLDPSRYSYYSNISGVFNGPISFLNLTTGPPVNGSIPAWQPWADELFGPTNETEREERRGVWDWAATSKIGFNIGDRLPPPVKADVPDKLAVMHGGIELTNERTGSELNLVFEGVHFVRNGSIYGFAEPNRIHPDLRELPSIVPGHVRNATSYVLEAELKSRIAKTIRMVEAGTFDVPSQNDNVPQTTCSFMFFAQVLPARVSQAVMEELEAESENPTGITTIQPPEMAIRGLLLSEDCGLAYSFERAEGISSKRWYRKLKTYGSTAALLYMVMAVLLSRQITRSRTPAGISRVSRWTFLSQSIGDSISFASHATFAIVSSGRTSLALFAAGFLALVLFIYEIQFAFLIHQIQAPEDVPVTIIPRPSTGVREQGEAGPGPGAQAGAQQQADSPRIWQSAWTYLQTDPTGRLLLRSGLLTMTACLILLPLVFAPSLGFVFTATLYSSFWAPQIVRSARRGRPSGLSMEYVVGTTVCRLLLALYFLACPKNVLEVEPRPWIWGVAVFMFLQIGLLAAQGYFGPSFFVPKAWAAEPGYDYHPPLPLSDTEAPDRSLGDCSICMDTIVLEAPSRRSMSEKDNIQNAEPVQSVEGTSASAGGLWDAVQVGVGMKAARKNYSLAPCSHLFHTACLERWLAVKNICPQCRRPLPPI